MGCCFPAVAVAGVEAQVLVVAVVVVAVVLLVLAVVIPLGPPVDSGFRPPKSRDGYHRKIP